VDSGEVKGDLVFEGGRMERGLNAETGREAKVSIV